MATRDKPPVPAPPRALARARAYAAGVRAEGRKVTWPSRSETLATTGAVFVMILIMTLFLFAADQAMAWAVRWVIALGM
ncbi:MAG TPA: preprotein translocase subunit SecE [Rhodospirillaceae bacterium]|jgi:preprotein translocase subunit SecE|nr:preprotein translocase subunit SecE [Alphaproteobacteria bacterium]HBH26401.1 preprotein translocase subunit SecE [Rhodospirillaceae bacterium]